MLALGVTGGVGVGKSASVGMLQQAGVPVVDTDDLARELVALGQPAYLEIVDAFGPEVLCSERRLDRKRLAAIVFSDPSRRMQLEAILHPRIRGAWVKWLKSPTALSSPVAVVIIPLLFEKDYDGHFDSTVAVACSPATQASRLRKRDWSDEEIRARLAAQMPMFEKMARARFVVWTEGGMDAHRRQWIKILDHLGKNRFRADAER